MGAIAEAFVAYAQPLIEMGDGSKSALDQAMAVSHLCWHVALLPEDQQVAAIEELRPAFKMTDEEFADFREQIIFPMIQRHYEMFPQMHGPKKQTSPKFTTTASPTTEHPRTKRNAPCPCGSGRKYKHCCGAKK